MAKKIPLKDWAARHYDPPPTPWVLRRWARDKEIQPPPERVGREWYVREDARRGEVQAEAPRLTLVDRMRAAGA